MKVHRHTHYPDRLPTPAGSPGLISTTDSWLSLYVSVGVACRPEGDEHWSLIWWQIEILENDNKRKEMEILHEPLRSAPPPTTHLPSQRHTWLPLKLRLNIDANGLHQAVRGKERAEDRKGKSVNCQRVCSSGGCFGPSNPPVPSFLQSSLNESCAWPGPTAAPPSFLPGSVSKGERG